MLQAPWREQQQALHPDLTAGFVAVTYTHRCDCVCVCLVCPEPQKCQPVSACYVCMHVRTWMGVFVSVLWCLSCPKTTVRVACVDVCLWPRDKVCAPSMLAPRKAGLSVLKSCDQLLPWQPCHNCLPLVQAAQHAFAPCSSLVSCQARVFVAAAALLCLWSVTQGMDGWDALFPVLSCVSKPKCLPVTVWYCLTVRQLLHSDRYVSMGCGWGCWCCWW